MKFPKLGTSLKNKLILAFIALILLPYSVLTYYNFSKMESVLRMKIGDQSQQELERMKKSFEEIITITNRTFTLLEQDPNISDMLRQPEKFDSHDTQSNLEKKFKAITNSIFLTSPQVYYTVLDRKGHFYTSYKPSEQLSFHRLSSEPWYTQAQQTQATTTSWQLEKNYVHKDESPNPLLLSVSGSFRQPNGQVYAVVRISIDYLDWFRAITYDNSSRQQYFMMSGGREIMAQQPGVSVTPADVSGIVLRPEQPDHQMDRDYIINYSYIPWLDWYLVKRVPREVLFAEIERLKTSFYISFLATTTAFIIITFAIAVAAMRPLKHLQYTMQEVVRKHFKVRLPEDDYYGELRGLAQTFNRMVGDINELVHRLKAEERQKEAVRFQMLLSQTNPHFLLNTLNTIKWMALSKGDEEVADICVSLGRLLEASLNSDVELLYLKDEVELVEAFVYIQNFRYKQTIAIHYTIEESLRFALVPKLSLQLLVENSIKHGIDEGKKLGGQIRIRAFATNNELYVEVEDNGIGMAQSQRLKTRESRQRSGIGLSNLKERLSLLFKEKAGLSVRELDPGTLVQYRMPLLLSEPFGKEA